MPPIKKRTPVKLLPTRKFAEGTEVPAEKTRWELENMLRKQGATEFMVSVNSERSVFIYRLNGRMIKHEILYPKVDEVKKARRTSIDQTDEDLKKAKQEAEWRRRWRALLLLCKARFEYIDLGGSTFDREFLSDTMLPDGSLVSDAVLPRIAFSYESGEMPKLLGA